MNIKSGDKVIIIAGKDKGKKGKVLQVFPKRGLVSVEGLNLLIKHMRPRREGEKGQRIEFPAPLNSSNLMVVCPKCAKQARVGYKILESKKKVRICKKCKEVID
ncbi:MAG: 50S ribosomal protein L24 [bacterium]|nr:50S ribosomal protein L24 [bacterium]